MAFIDKAKSFASKAAEQAGDAVEITKLNAKIKSAEKDIVSLKCDIADFFLAKEEAPEEIADLISQIQAKFTEIEGLHAEIEELKK